MLKEKEKKLTLSTQLYEARCGGSILCALEIERRMKIKWIENEPKIGFVHTLTKQNKARKKQN